MGTPNVVDSLSFEIERLRTRVAASRSPEAFSQLGRLLRQRFALTASHEDLDAAVQAFESALEVASNNETDVVPHLSNLAAALSDRFVKERRREDLDRAIEFASSAVERAAVENAEQPEYLANLGAALYTRYEVTGDLRDLDQAIVSSERALRLVDSKNQSAYLTNLSTALQARFSRTHDLATLDRAIQFARLAVEATADADPARWSRLLTLCVSLSLRVLQTRSSESADQALGVLAVAANESSISDSERLDIADLTATVAASQSRWLTAMQALSQVLASTEGVSFERLNAQVATHRARLASDAASCAIHLNDVKRAIELFDIGRARFLTGESAFRANLSTLAQTAPHLVGPLVELHDYLSIAVSQDMKSQPVAARRDRAQIRKRWYEEVERVRELPGFDSFLAASDYSLVEISSREIVTAINISRFGSHALLVSRDGVTTVGLPALTIESAAKQAEIYEKAVLVSGNPRSARNRELLLLDMLAWLWDVLGAPVAEVLQSRGERPHISWCTSGPLGVLPVHAAGIYGPNKDGTENSLLDLADFSYVPNIQAGIKSVRESPAEFGNLDASALIVAPQSHDSPLAHSPIEVRALRNNLVHSDTLSGRAARRDSIVQEMSAHMIVHFIGHGKWDADNPGSSGILLEDGVLSVEDMLRGNLENTRLAVLSASNTAARTIEASDEFLTPASAFFAAGCRNVVGTLFSIRDSDASEFAAYFYESLVRDGSEISREKVSRATRIAVSYLRRKYPETPSAWAGFVHLTI